jgi:hypothetical protein
MKAFSKNLDKYLSLQEQIHDYFGYVEDWVAIPIEDSREYYWRLDGEGPGIVYFADTEKALINADGGNYYAEDIYTQRFLPKWVYRGTDYTMVCVDTKTDGNRYLRVFENSKERHM